MVVYWVFRTKVRSKTKQNKKLSPSNPSNASFLCSKNVKPGPLQKRVCGCKAEKKNTRYVCQKANQMEG